MLLPIAAVAFLAFVFLRPALGKAMRRMTWRRTNLDKVLSVAMVVAALVVLLRGNVWAAFCLFGLSLWMLGRTKGAGAVAPSRFALQRSATVELAVDRVNGRRFARVVAGPHRGAALDELALEGCLSVLKTCRAGDPEGARLLETYLDGRFAGWRTAGEGDHDPGPRRARATGGMTEEQAYQVLGLARGATREQIVRTHRMLMKTWHPDGGGTAELAARANEAKEVLLRRHG